MNALIIKLLELLKRKMDQTKPTVAGQKLLETAKRSLGKDLTPKDEVLDEVACMATINALHQEAFGEPIGGDASTYLGYLAMKNGRNWLLVDVPLPGDIIISPTGFNNAEGKKLVPKGHVGICLENNQIASNSSATGLFTVNYDLWTWRYRYRTVGHFPVFFFRKVV